MRRAVMVMVLVLVCGAFASAQKLAGGDEAAIAQVRSQYLKAVEAQDAAGIANLYAQDGVEMPPNAPLVKGRAAIEAYHKKTAAAVKATGLKLTPTETKVIGDTAYDVGSYSQQLTPAGGKPFQDRGKYVVLLKKTAGSWAVLYAIYNSDLPPQPAPAAR